MQIKLWNFIDKNEQKENKGNFYKRKPAKMYISECEGQKVMYVVPRAMGGK